MTFDEWKQASKVLQDTFPHTPVGAGTWFDLLRDLDGAAVLAAIIHLCRTTEAFPSVAAIRKLAEPKHLDQGDGWAEVMAAVSSVGYMGTPQWSHPAIEAGVRALGGWKSICQSEIDEHPTMRAQFRRAFEAAAERTRRDQTFIALGVAPTPQALSSGQKAVGA